MTETKLIHGCSDWIDRSRAAIARDREWLFTHPELGYKERETAAYVTARLRGMEPCPTIQEGLGLTGIKATLPCGNPQGIHIGLLCELDAVTSPLHPSADPASGAAHACGHSFQITVMLAAFEALLCSGTYRELCGSISFFAVPAEEYIELAYRLELRRQGKIRYLSGKQELLSLGAFDDVDLLLMCHAHPDSAPGEVFLDGGSLGFLAKTVRFLGKTAHAGAAPYLGVNALNAATAAMTGMHMNRETFRDEDHIRIHPILTKGGDVVNSVPAEVVMETYVRSSNLDAMRDASVKVDSSVRGGCVMVGASAEIETLPGYLPLRQDASLGAVWEQALEGTEGFVRAIRGVDMPGSSDIGDLSHLLPVIQPTIGGFSGSLHGSDFAELEADRVTAMTAKAMASTVVMLLGDGAKQGRRIKETFMPILTKEAYLRYLDGCFTQQRVE